MKCFAVAVLAAAAPWLGVLGDFSEGSAHAAAGTTGADEPAKQYSVRGWRDESNYTHSLLADNTSVGEPLPGQDTRDAAGDADDGLLVPASDERGRASRALAGGFSMKAIFLPEHNISIQSVTRGKIDYGCGGHNQNCGCAQNNGTVSMWGKGTEGTATGLSFYCDMTIFGPDGGMGTPCTWQIKMPWVGNNSYDYYCPGFIFNMRSKFHTKGTTNDEIVVSILFDT
jgi:hypothetical protein